MNTHRKGLVRLAVAIHQQLTVPTDVPARRALPLGSWQALRVIQRQLERALECGWQLAAAALERDLKHAVERLVVELSWVRESFASPPSPAHQASTSEIYADLVTLHEEFPEVAYDLRAATLTVTTQRIVLQEKDLGPFAIVLRWQALGQRRSPYEVQALEPSPAASNSNITHPHVDGGALCEGEARQPLKLALAQGRIGDFFTIVRQLLQTYNDGSPYVALDEWNGTRCSDCSYLTSADQVWDCHRCGNSLCDDCQRTCTSCSSATCSACSHTCAVCDSDVCDRCRTQCTACGKFVCGECLHAPPTCENCHDVETEVTEDEDAAPADEVAPLLPVRLGEAALPA